MKTLLKNIKGDKVLWAAIAVLALFSFMPVYSASSNLAFSGSGVGGNTLKYLIKHGVHLLLGFSILYGIHRIPYRYFRGLSYIALPIVVVLLIVTILQGKTIDSANASRWITIPIVGMSFQTSALASVVLLTFVAGYLARVFDKKYSFKDSLVPLWLPVGVVLVLILPANFSTTAIMFVMVATLVFIGGYPLRYLGIIFLSGILLLTLFIGVNKLKPELMPNRVDTWIKRIESFMAKDEVLADGTKKEKKEQVQVLNAKIAIATGGIIGKGPGKSEQRNLLSQSSSDFIYAIVVEEFGLVGGLLILFTYLIILVRILIISQKATNAYGKLLAIGVGLPIVFQAFINMGVAVELFPTTGQTLPLISSGGSSIWMTCMALGMVLSVSAQEEPKEKEELNPLDILSETI